MDLSIVKEFVILASTCNYQTASSTLSMSQSALSKHIQKLEDELNLSLFSREKRSVTLTEEGEIFLKHARNICKSFDELEHELQSIKGKKSKALRISFLEVHNQYDIIDELTDFHHTHPAIQLSLKETTEIQIKPDLTSGTCDFVFAAVVNDLPNDEFGKIVYRQEHMVALVPADHPLAGRSKITIDDIRGESFIEHSTPLERDLFTELCTQYDFQPNVVAGVTHSSTILRMVSQGIGISVLSDGCAGRYKEFNLCKIEIEPLTSFNIYIVYKKGRLSQAARDFINYFRKN